jgi:hypothetical protein
MQYIKHYYVNESNGSFCCEAAEPAYKIHPWRQYSGLSVKIWLTDAEGVDVCLSELPDSTTVSTVSSPCGKNAVQVLTEAEYQSVATPYFEAQTLANEAQEAQQSGDNATAEAKGTASAAKLVQATDAIRAL